MENLFFPILRRGEAGATLGSLVAVMNSHMWVLCFLVFICFFIQHKIFFHLFVVCLSFFFFIQHKMSPGGVLHT